MCGMFVCLAASMAGAGISGSTQPLPGGGIEYVVQLEPLAVRSLQWTDLQSAVPADIRDIRSVRIIMVGQRPALPRPSPPAGESPQTMPTSSAAISTPGSGEERGPPAALSPASPLPRPVEDPPLAPIPPPGPDLVPHPSPGTAASFARETKESATSPPPIPAPAQATVDPPQKTSFLVPKETRPPDGQSGASEDRAVASKDAVGDADRPRPRLGLLVGLGATAAGALSGMLFFAWVAWDYRRRYLAIVARMQPAGA
jgi:hypothetical protein